MTCTDIQRYPVLPDPNCPHLDSLVEEQVGFEAQMSFEAIVRSVCQLLKKNVEDFRDTLFRIEELSKKSWDESVEKELRAMRCWTQSAFRAGSIAISILSTVPNIHPPLIAQAVTLLSIPGVLDRFEGDMNKLAEASSNVINALEASYKQVDNLNQTRLEADKTESASHAQTWQTMHQKNGGYRQEHDKYIQEMIRTIEELQTSIVRSIQTMFRT